MAVQLFVLRGVPEDEAEEIRALLTEHGFDFYETPAGAWGMSMPALWLRDESQLGAAHEVLNQYHQARSLKVQNEYRDAKHANRHRTIWRMFREHPLRYLFFLSIIILIAYFSISPFINFGQP